MASFRSFRRSFRRRPRPWPLALATPLLAGALALGCSGAAQAQAGADHDRPVPPEEPRAELRLELDLTPSQECEERFDLELYRDRRIELVAWDDRAGACTGREVVIRYLSSKITREELLAAVQKLVRRAGEPAGKEATP